MLPASFARDASRTRAQVRAIVTAEKTLGIDSSGRITWISPSLTERAELRRGADLLETIAASSTTEIVPPGTPFDQLTNLAQRSQHAVWCDDSAGRQRLRGRGLPTFSTVDLLDELSAVAPLLDLEAARQHLAVRFVVDLPLTGAQVAVLGEERGWGTGDRWTPAQAVLLRPGWWSGKNREAVAPENQEAVSWAASWRDDWETVAEAAATESPLSLTSACKAAVQGLRASVTSGLQPQRHLQLLVLTLDTCHRMGANPPDQLLDQLETVVPAGTSPDPRVVRHGLAEHLHARGVDGADEAARLLPGVPV